MICYRDMTFCGFKDCQRFKECANALTDKVKQEADKWWGENTSQAPISLYAEKPSCFESTA